MDSVFCVWRGFYTKDTLVSMGLLKGLHFTFNNDNNSSSSWTTDLHTFVPSILIFKSMFVEKNLCIMQLSPLNYGIQQS